MVFSIFAELCNHNHNLIIEYFITPKRKPISSHSPSPPLPPTTNLFTFGALTCDVTCEQWSQSHPAGISPSWPRPSAGRISRDIPCILPTHSLVALVLERSPAHPPHLPREGQETQRGEDICPRSLSGWEQGSWPGASAFSSTPKPSSPSCPLLVQGPPLSRS